MKSFAAFIGLSGWAAAEAATGAEPLDVPMSTRQHWMHHTAEVLIKERGTHCPTQPFTAVVVNHTDVSGLGKLVCSGVNNIERSGDPTDHGEIVAIRNCARILTDPSGEYRLTPAEATHALHQLSLYTNCEACPMCASAIRWSGFREYIFGTKLETVKAYKWQEIDIPSSYIFDHSKHLPTKAAYIGPVLSNETDPLFAWQYTNGKQCPPGCSHDGETKCVDDETSLVGPSNEL